MKKSLFVLFAILFSLSTQAQFDDYIVSTDDYTLIDVDTDTDKDAEKAEPVPAPILFKTGVFLLADKNTATVDLSYVEKSRTAKYKFSLYNMEGDLEKEYRFIRLQATDKTMVLDVDGLPAGKYIVEISHDMPQVLATTATSPE